MDAAVQAKIKATLAAKGKTVTVSRNGTKLGITSGFEVTSETVNDSNSLYAQTAQTRKRLFLAPIKQQVLAGDTVVLEKVTYTVLKVEEFRPALVTLYMYLEVV